MFCNNCGNEIDDDVKFCTKCGKRIETKNTEKAVPGVGGLLLNMPVLKITGIALLAVVSLIYLINMFGMFDSFESWADTYDMGFFMVLFVLLGLVPLIQFVMALVTYKKTAGVLVRTSISFLITIVVIFIWAELLKDNFMDSKTTYLTYLLMETHAKSVGINVVMTVISLICFLADNVAKKRS